MRRSDLKYAKVMGLVTLYIPFCVIPTQILILLHQFNMTSIRAETTSLYQMHSVAISLLCNPICHALIRKHYRRAYWFVICHPMVLCGATSATGVFDFGKNRRFS
ncbi:hypothetical protein QZH41_008612 [Actinostola sp. cb2023]|nr:hypothetical protein QZH41_008612 [Actinostola sp. cb2023]